MEVLVARSYFARLLGFMFRRPGPNDAILFPDCRYVHTSFVRGTLDLLFLDSSGRVLRVDEKVPPFRVRGEAEASSVLELAGGVWSTMTEATRGETLRMARDSAGSPRSSS